MNNRFLDYNGCYQLTHSSKHEIKSSFEQLKKSVYFNIEQLKAEAMPTWENYIIPFYNTQCSIEQFINRIVTIYVFSITNSDYQEVYGELFSDFADLEKKLFTTCEIIDKIILLQKGSEYNYYDQNQINYIQSILNKAQILGTLMDEKLKDSISEINNQITHWSDIFNQNVQKSTLAAGIIVTDINDFGNMPRQWLFQTSEQFNTKFSNETHKKSNPSTGPWYVSLTSGAYTPFMEHSQNRDLKKELYAKQRKISSEGNFDNTEAMLNLLTKRKELANILGYKNFLEYSLEFASANSQQLDQLCNSLINPFKRSQEQLHKKYQELAHNDGIKYLEPWDIAFYDRVYKDSLGYNKEKISEYFTYHETKNEIFKLFEECFSIQFKNATSEVTSWAPNIEFYYVTDKEGTELGGFYIDPFQRAGEKIVGTQSIGAFCATIGEPFFVNEKNLKPICVLSFGFNIHTPDSPSFLKLEDLAFFFHEFGHLLAILLKKQNPKTINPTFYLENDTIEFESMLLECWAQNPYVLKRISKHYKTGEPLSDSEIKILDIFLEKEINVRVHGLLSITKISIDLYSSFDPAKDDIHQLVDNITKEIFAAPYFAENKFINSCTPLFTLNGYLASTYMYLWAMTFSYTYMMDIESTGWTDETIKKLGQTLKDTLYSYTAIGQSMNVLKIATGKDIPDFEGFARSRISLT